MRRLLFALAAGFSLGLSSQAPGDVLVTVRQRDVFTSALAPSTASLSADGRFVAFISYERLSPDDTDERADVYVVDRTTGMATLESAGEVDGRAILSDCLRPRLSGDARFLVFETASPRGELQIGSDIVLRDRSTGVLRLISRAADGRLSNGWSGTAAINGDGTVIAFTSTATDLTDTGDANGRGTDVYVYRTATNAIERVSLDARGVQLAEGASMGPTLSADGTLVAFTSTAILTPGRNRRLRTATGRPGTRVYLRDLTAGTTVLIAPPGVEPDGSSMGPSISRDGRVIAFASDARNLVRQDRNRAMDVFLFFRATGRVVLASRTPNGASGNGPSLSPAISGDGRFVAFQSAASNLSCASRCGPGEEDVNLLPDVFVFDARHERLTRVSAGNGASWMAESIAPAIDDAGTVVAFSSRHPIDGSDTRNDYDLFVRTSPRVRR